MTPDAAARRRSCKSKLFWVGVLYFSEGFPLGVFYEIFPVYFRQQGVELRQIGVLSLLGLVVDAQVPVGARDRLLPPPPPLDGRASTSRWAAR